MILDLFIYIIQFYINQNTFLPGFIIRKEHIKHSMKSTAPADCVTEIRIGNSVLVVSGFFKQSATETAADKMAKVLEAEAATQKSAI